MLELDKLNDPDNLTDDELWELMKQGIDWRDAYELRNFGTPWLYGPVYFKVKPPTIKG